MTDKAQQKRRTNRVFKSLHKPLTYLGVERTLFYFVCVSAVGAFNLFNSILAGVAVFFAGLSSVIGSRTAIQPFSASLPGPNGTSCAMTLPSSRSPSWRFAYAASG